jgi:phosphoribosylformimino-5-aminoimidazole carboxamide ribotide isomerase
MLIPSIDLLGGKIVQLVQGQTQEGGEPKLAFDDFEYWIGRFRSYQLVQLIDLDAAMGTGDNSALVAEISKRLPVQVGGGIRTIEGAHAVLNAGARRVIVGSSLFKEEQGIGSVNTAFASDLAAAIGSKHLVAGIDSRGGKIAIKGWKAQVALTPEEAIPMLEPYAAAFLYTHIDGEGLMQGFPIEIAARLRSMTQRQLIVAGGIRTQQEIDALQAIHVDAVAGMAVYTDLLSA